MKLEKLKIIAYKCPTDEEEVTSYSVLINPESIKAECQINYAEEQAAGTTTPMLKFQNIPSENISFNLIFDGTGLITTAPKSVQGKSVMEQIQDFKNTTIAYHGSIHQPYFLHLAWGEYFYCGYLTNLSIDYKLFKPNGSPVRAEASVTFMTSDNLKNAKKKANDQSPDMTHTKVIHSGDRLPSMCSKIYNDVNYYIQVAQFNQLNHIRKLKAGSTLSFPPVND